MSVATVLSSLAVDGYPGYSCKMTTSSGHYIVLSQNPLRFEPVGRSNSVFFDEANKEVKMFV